MITHDKHEERYRLRGRLATRGHGARAHYTHRRAALLEDILEHGTPAVINQYDAGEKFDLEKCTWSVM